MKAESFCYSVRVRRYCQLSYLFIDFLHTFSVTQSKIAHQNVSVNQYLTYSKCSIFYLFFENIFASKNTMLNNNFILNIRLPETEIRTKVYCHTLIAITK